MQHVHRSGFRPIAALCMWTLLTGYDDRYNVCGFLLGDVGVVANSMCYIHENINLS